MTSRILIPWAALAVAMTLVPGVGLAQTAPVPALLSGAFSSTRCPCPLVQPRLSTPAPPREVSLKLTALLPLTGASVGYARNINDGIAFEGALDFVSMAGVRPPTVLAIAQMRVSDPARFKSERFVTAGIARATSLGRRHDGFGFSGVGLLVGGGSQHLLTERGGMRLEFQYIRFEPAPTFRMTLGVFFGVGE